MAPLPLEYHPDAVFEAAAARSWYAEIDPQLGVSFADELERVTERIAAAPDRWPRHLHETRVVMLHRFPYLVVYRRLDDRVQVVAIHHAKRRPDYWHIRMTD
ncbi:MAG: type II toxin-antitoxin system RelE/ParE family toxin [Planctomycetaceae bacterium]|nr:type II toxin-antitoxin system RelE/ParE family toxin [Planctomycetaceae bacterium]